MNYLYWFIGVTIILSTGLFLLAGAAIVVQIFLTPIVRIFWPLYGILPPTFVEEKQADDRREIHLLAIDLLIKARLEREAIARKRLQEMMNPIVQKPESPKDVEVFDLSLLSVAQKSITKIEPRPPQSTFSPEALYHLVKFPHGVEKPCHYLIVKQSQRGRGLRQVWLPLPNRAIKFSKHIADAYLKMPDFQDAFCVPANASARHLARREQHANA